MIAAICICYSYRIVIALLFYEHNTLLTIVLYTLQCTARVRSECAVKSVSSAVCVCSMSRVDSIRDETNRVDRSFHSVHCSAQSAAQRYSILFCSVLFSARRVRVHSVNVNARVSSRLVAARASISSGGASRSLSGK